MMVDPVKKTARNQLPAGPGRPKGQQNKLNRELKQMILDALDKAGGVTYLTTQAKANPKAFMSLLGRVLPLQVTGEGGGPIEFAQITRKIVRPDQ